LVLFVENSVGRLFLEQWLEDVTQEGVLLLFKVHILNLLKHALASHFCYQEGLSRATDLKSDFSSVLVIADHEVLLDHGFRACVPIRVAGDSLLGQNFFLAGLMVHLFLLRFWFLRGWLPGRGLTLTAQISKEISRTFSRHRAQLLSKRILGDHRVGSFLLLSGLGFLLNLFTKEPLNLECDLFGVDAKLLHQLGLVTRGESLDREKLKFFVVRGLCAGLPFDERLKVRHL
jgi:hypothetical protein